MRHALFAAALACSAAAGTAVLAGMSRPVLPDDQDWRRQELVFLKAAYDRMQADLQSQPASSSLASLRREQASLLRRMAEIAGPLSTDRLPNGVRSVLGGGTGQVAAPPSAPVEVAAMPVEPVLPKTPVRLQSALALAHPAEPSLDGIELDAELHAPLHLPHHKKVAGKPPADKTAEAKPATARDKAADGKPAAAARDKIAAADPH